MFKTLKKNISITNIMDFGQQRMQQQEAARQMMYQNPGYQFERRQMKSLIVDVSGGATKKYLSDPSEFSVNLFEPLIIDKLSDIYLDNFTTYNSMLCDDNNRSMFSLQINEFNVNSNVASTGTGQNIFNRILIPNEHNDVDDVHSAVIHKGKKMNYVCSINPGKLTTISGKITDLSGKSMFASGTPADGGLLHYIKLNTGLVTNVKADTDLVISGTHGDTYKTAYYTDKGSTDIYFFGNSNTTLSTSTGVESTLDDCILDVGFGGIASGDRLVNGTYRRGAYPRFIAEFVIVSRE